MNKDKKPDEIYCPECGKIIKKNTVICPHCGIQVKELKTTSTFSVKSKAVAVVLAIFFSFFSWLYTYGRNEIKFWVFSIITSILCFLRFGTDLSEGSIIYSIFPVVTFLIWVYSIIDNSTKSYKFFSDYPYG
ncbi:hypothetical protein ES707_04594 [subsurface metagenome]